MMHLPRLQIGSLSPARIWPSLEEIDEDAESDSSRDSDDAGIDSGQEHDGPG